MDINKVILQGQVGAVRCISVNNIVSKSFSLATTIMHSLADGTAMAETTWHIIQYRETPESPFLVEKGDTVRIEGYIRTSRYTNHDGEDRTFTEIVAETAEIVKKS